MEELSRFRDLHKMWTQGTCTDVNFTGHRGRVADACESDPKCANSSGAHPAYSRMCPRRNQEKKFFPLKVRQNLSYQEAKKRVLFESQTSFADSVRKSPKLRVALDSAFGV